MNYTDPAIAPAPTTPAPTTPAVYPRKASYWTVKGWGGISAAAADFCGIKTYLNPLEHEGLCCHGYDSPQALMKELRKWGRKPSQFNTSIERFARVEVTSSGFNVVYFPSYRAAVETHACKSSKAVLCACPFCHRADQLDIIGWTHEREDGSEYIGDAVKCNRCDAIAPLNVWQRRLDGSGEQTTVA